jgi:hypothetical protein
MEFAPLRYAIGTVTIWHGAILVAIMAMAAYAHYGSNAGNSGSAGLFPGLPLITLMIGWMYLLAAPVVGQLVGDKYAFAQVWPSALVLGGLMAAGFLVAVFVGNTGAIWGLRLRVLHRWPESFRLLCLLRHATGGRAHFLPQALVGRAALGAARLHLALPPVSH